jgi:hypothetical protein
MINPTNFQDGGSNTSLLSAQFRVGCPSGKKWLHELIARADVIIQASAASAPNKATSTAFLALIADETFFNLLVKRL